MKFLTGILITAAILLQFGVSFGQGIPCDLSDPDCEQAPKPVPISGVEIVVGAGILLGGKAMYRKAIRRNQGS